MEKKPTDKTSNQQFDETIAQDCQSDTDAGFLDEAKDIPASIGRYEIDRLLGRGGMGSVYLARDTNLRREVALKVPKFSSETNPQLIERFYREARSAANLSHPNLCPVFDVGEIDGTHYIAMAYIKGRPLSDYVQPAKPPEPRVAATIVRKVALAMEDAHKSGILHRDLKPANIMIDQRKEPVVMDFGLACPQDTGEDTRLTREGTLLGSPAYMPPEQLTGRTDQIGPTSDVYSLGVVLYELLTGRLPFEGVHSTIALIGRILSETPKDIAEVRSGIDASLAEICRKAMAKEASQRYSSMKLFAKDLSKYLRSDGKGETMTLVEPKPSPDAKLIRLEEQAKLVRTLCKTGQLEAASQILHEMAADPASKGSEAGRWAESMMPKVRSRMTQKMSVAATRSEVPVTAPAAGAATDDLFANLPTTAVSTINDPLAVPNALGMPAAYKRPQRSNAAKGSSGVPKWLAPILVATFGVGALVVGGVYWFNRTPGAMDDAALDVPPTQPASIEPAATSVTVDRNSTPSPSFEPNQQARREQGRSRFNEGNTPQRRDSQIRADELMQLDTNGDGKVALSQLTESQSRFFRFADQNEDGFLDRAEMDDMERRRPRQPSRIDDGPGPSEGGLLGPGPLGPGPLGPGPLGPGPNGGGPNGAGTPGDRPFPRGGPPNGQRKGPRGSEPFEPRPGGR